jgi:hypothetical protein
MACEREAHHGVLGTKIVDHEGTANSPGHVEQTTEKSINGGQGANAGDLLDNSRPTKDDTQ